MLGPAVATTTLALGAFALWGIGVAALSVIFTGIGLSHSMVAQVVTVFGPIAALLYCSARW